MRRSLPLLLGSLLAVVLMMGCSNPSQAEPEVVVDGLNGPTQFAVLDDGRFLIAQLNGEEEGKTGEVIVVDPATDQQTVLLSQLDKPTGVLNHQGALWVMTRRGLIRAEWDGQGKVGTVETIIDNLPYNGRSEGTLTLLSDERIAYETSGAIEGSGVVDGSGRMWAYDTATKKSSVIATGLKNAYAHVLLPDGRLVVTEIGDNIVGAPVEELNVLDLTGIDLSVTVSEFGWPDCPGDKQCGGVTAPLALFDPKATPAGIALAADGLSLYVTLLTTGQLVAVPVGGGAQRIVSTDLELPLHAALSNDGRILVGEHGAGRIVAISP
jgi:glucose/arabinose dehydrogenase